MTTDDDLTHRLSDLLTRSADAVDVHPDLDAVTGAPTVISLVAEEATGLGRGRGARLHPVRRLALGAVAAAAVVALLAAALTLGDDDPAQSVASDGGTTTVPTTDRPTGAVYPVIDTWPAGFALADAVIQDVGMGAEPGPTAVIGVTGIDAVTNGVVVRSFRGTPSAYEMAETTPVTVGGREGLTLQSYGHGGDERGATLVLPDGQVTLVLSGHDPVGLVEAAPGAITGRLDGGTVELVIGDLPSPFEVVAGPTTPHSARSWPSLHANSDLPGNPPPFLFVEVEPGDPLAPVAQAGTAHRVAIGDAQGWIAETSGVDDDGAGATYIAWAVADGVTVSVSGAVDRETALATARAVRFVDRAEWEDTYGIEVDGDAESAVAATQPTAPPSTATTQPPDTTTTPPSSTDGPGGATTSPTTAPATTTTPPIYQTTLGGWRPDHPLMGSPLPPLVANLEEVPLATNGRWSVILAAGLWCDSCLELLAGLDAPVAAERSDLFFVGVEDELEAVEAHREETGGRWLGRVADNETYVRWSLTAPTVVIVDPGRTVRAVAEVPVPAGEVLDALRSLRATGS